MKESRFEGLAKVHESEDDQPEKRGFTWAALVVLLVLTLLFAIGMAYLITVHNFPARS